VVVDDEAMAKGAVNAGFLQYMATLGVAMNYQGAPE
jgi:hypothetical protein